MCKCGCSRSKHAGFLGVMISFPGLFVARDRNVCRPFVDSLLYFAMIVKVCRLWRYKFECLDNPKTD